MPKGLETRTPVRASIGAAVAQLAAQTAQLAAAAAADGFRWPAWAATRGGTTGRSRRTTGGSGTCTPAGVLVPAPSITAADLVADLPGLAEAGGVQRADVGRATAVEPVDGGHRVVGERGTVEARVVVLALGVGTSAPAGGPVPAAKRQLFVLDLPVDADRVPFPRGAAAEQVLWGVDPVAKLPRIAEPEPGLLAVTGGSAVRACVPIGARVAARVGEALDRTRSVG